jgi:glycosyltransferase involved in cell wall biosynthesis
MSNFPLISIIIPNYIREKYISETLDSILDQTYQDWECIIVDDGSTDNSITIIDKYNKQDKRIKLIKRNRYPKGANVCRNIGFENAKGDYIVWFDSDDIMLKDYLAEQISAISRKDFDASICAMRLYYPETGEIKKWLSDGWKYDNYNTFIQNYIMFNYGIGICSILWRKDTLKTGRLFDENLQRSQEYEFYNYLFLSKKLKLAKTDKVLIHYRQHSGNYANQLAAGNTEKLKSALDAKLMVLNNVIYYNKRNESLMRYFKIDAISYLKFKNISPKVYDILVIAGENKEKATKIIKTISTINKNYKNWLSPTHLFDFAIKEPSKYNIIMFILKLKLKNIWSTIIYKLVKLKNRLI